MVDDGSDVEIKDVEGKADEIEEEPKSKKAKVDAAGEDE